MLSDKSTRVQRPTASYSTVVVSKVGRNANDPKKESNDVFETGFWSTVRPFGPLVGTSRKDGDMEDDFFKSSIKNRTRMQKAHTVGKK